MWHFPLALTLAQFVLRSMYAHTYKSRLSFGSIWEWFTALLLILNSTILFSVYIAIHMSVCCVCVYNILVYFVYILFGKWIIGLKFTRAFRAYNFTRNLPRFVIPFCRQYILASNARTQHTVMEWYGWIYYYYFASWTSDCEELAYELLGAAEWEMEHAWSKKDARVSNLIKY